MNAVRALAAMLYLATGVFGVWTTASVGSKTDGSESSSAGVSLFAPEDGGTPREAGRIVAVGPGEFQIRARAEEGRSVLTHAVSRVDLICRNDDAKAQDVTLHLDLSDDGHRTNADTNPFGGMSMRDFLFIQPPSQSWRQVDGDVSGWACTVRFSAPPGETKVGLSPWYTYGDYFRFVRSLPDHAHLTKTRLGTSDGGREHWELTITDPSVLPESKRTIFWHAREHAYETFSSYAMEGLIAYLLSDAAAEVRRHYRIVLHPMTNVDGVAQGYEYRRGYDYPQPRGTPTGKLTFAAIDRLRPDFAVTWHNWVAPRAVDCLFYTDSEEGKASRRAWDLFMQRFPSPRGVGHRWENETTPLSKNWFGRTLRESNLHEYAMKRYGTQVWGWEMPWWGRSEGDPTQAARRAGADFGRAFLATLDLIAAGPAPAEPEAVPVTVPRWEMHEFELHGRSHVENPFRAAALVGEFTSPSGKQILAEGFYDGGDTWRLRFTPDEEGEWRYLLRGEGVELHQRGRLRCLAPRGHGFIRIHPDDPYAFAYGDGTPFFPMGDTCYGLYSDSPITAALRTQYLQTRRAQRFNFVRLGILHSPTHGQTDPNYWPWGGTPGKPDLDRLNPAFFRGLDAVLAEMQAVGMNAELIVLNYYLPPFTDVKAWTPPRQQQWLRYVTARYAAFPNLFLWTIANEYETHPDGRYRLDVPDDPDWAKATARFIKEHDPYRHLVTVHPVISASTRGSSPRDPFGPPWRIGEFFGKGDAMDVLSQQTGQSGAGVVWDERLQCWTGDAPDLVASLRGDRRYSRPVLNTENGYEYLRGHPTERKQVHHTDKVRHSAWRIVCAGGYFAAGFHGTIGHSDAWNRIDAPNHYAFVVKDEGAAGQLGLLYDFFTRLPFWRLQPFLGVTPDTAVALAEPGQTYVIYLPQGGATTVDLSATPETFAVAWFNPRTGKTTEGGTVEGGASRTFQAPFEGDAVLLCVRDRSVPRTRVSIHGHESFLKDEATFRGTADRRLRLLIETDAGGDPDDEQSLVRFLLYANEWDVEGIIANRPATRRPENKNREDTGLGIVRRLLDAYGKCRPSLVQHDARYPTKESLWQRTVAGYNDADDAVRLILAAVDKDDPRPLWYSDWGTDHGAAVNNLQRALDLVLRERGPQGYVRFKSKLRLSSADKFGPHTTSIAPPFPIWVNTFEPPVEGKRWYHRFSALAGQAGGFDLMRDVLTNHGPLGALYPTNTTHWAKEGDTMTFLYLVPTGMNDPNEPLWGSWAGRYGLNERFAGRPYYWANQTDAWNGVTNRDNTLARWAADLQNDFRARLDWCVQPPDKANHAPQAVVNGSDGKEILHLAARPGQTVSLDAGLSRDPDGDQLAFEWFVYREAGTYEGEVTLTNVSFSQALLHVPNEAAGKIIHVILAVRDKGRPPLAAYRRAVVRASP